MARCRDILCFLAFIRDCLATLPSRIFTTLHCFPRRRRALESFTAATIARLHASEKTFTLHTQHVDYAPSFEERHDWAIDIDILLLWEMRKFDVDTSVFSRYLFRQARAQRRLCFTVLRFPLMRPSSSQSASVERPPFSLFVRSRGTRGWQRHRYQLFAHEFHHLSHDSFERVSRFSYHFRAQMVTTAAASSAILYFEMSISLYFSFHFLGSFFHEPPRFLRFFFYIRLSPSFRAFQRFEICHLRIIFMSLFRKSMLFIRI